MENLKLLNVISKYIYKYILQSCKLSTSSSVLNIPIFKSWEAHKMSTIWGLIHHLNRCPDSPGCESWLLLFLVLFAFRNLAQVCLFSILPEGSIGISFFFLSYSVSWLSHLKLVPRSDLSSPSLTSFSVISGSCVSSQLLPSPINKSWLIHYLLRIVSWSIAQW